MFIIQSVLSLFFLYALVRVVLRFKQDGLSIVSFIFWLVFWLAGIGLVLLPETSSYLAKIFGIGRGVDLIVYVSLALLFFMQFRLMAEKEKLKKEITLLTRQLALDKAFKTDSSTPKNLE
ncbi:MAG: DUF2304 domain-containing protein [Candidatus Magasanikbacteria bacterium CG10_big_fil_rev_8_21_14_0_10_40_10]|uniref:DUF2304 domain-containing protein n=1 Tax=Candidatus Magasanikbacteria bacterium CG10_big_fil_rev_8_21_14_0_10_40_10 TaxID=1974648 RepID=A0A2M6W503_9BACT|nr:MAG: DUF2304 domain-containing protein [Candidatus Magasanikbacteria bacterium CG10_big_fil_rev_8_21_14_0_10_40_10]